MKAEQSAISACFTPGGRLSSRAMARHLDAQVKALAHKNEALRLALRDQDLLALGFVKACRESGSSAG